NRLAHVLVVPRGRSPEDYRDRPVGTGPYRFLRWERGKSVSVEAFADYWGGPPSVERAEFVTLGTTDAVLSALARNAVDVVHWSPERMAVDPPSAPGFRIASRPAMATSFLWFRSTGEGNGKKNPFADRRVRQAVSLAIDRRQLVALLGGTAE